VAETGLSPCVSLPVYPSIHTPTHFVPTYLPNYSIPTYVPSTHPPTHVYYVYVCIYMYVYYISIFKNKLFCHLRPGLSSCLIHWDFPTNILPSLFGLLANCEKRLLASSCMFVRLSLSLCVGVCVCVCPHGTTRLTLDGFLWNLIFACFSKIRRENPSSLTIWKE
jgi:hypothetical protein